MKRLSLLLLLLALPTLSEPLFAQTTAFTYQGRLTDNGSPASGNYDLQFTLKNAVTAGNTVGSALTNAPVGVTNGLFTVTLDFGADVFPGAARWLEIGVRTNGSGAAYTALSPRQAVTSTPYAIRALTAASAATAISASTANSVPASGITGTLGDARLSTNVALLTIPNTSASATATPIINSGFITGANVASGGSGYVSAPTVTVNDSTGSGSVITANLSGGSVVRLTVQSPGSSYSSGTTLTLTPPPSNAYQVFSSMNIFNGVNTFINDNNEFTGSFTGNGAGLTNLGAINLSGILPDARLSANVALLNGSPDFSGAVTASSFSGSGASLTGLNASQLTSGTVPAAALGNGWKTAGNSGTTPGTHFVGTTDNKALEFKVNGSRALRLEPNATSPNVIGGYSGNYIASGVAGATISGGGLNGNTNSIFANYSAIGGGDNNTIQTNAFRSTIGGGYGNTIQTNAFLSTIGGGNDNTIQPNANSSTIGGGYGNTIQTNANASTIGGGNGNTIQTNADYSTIGGGNVNTIQINANSSTIGGGNGNTIQTNANSSTIGGGNGNTIQTNAYVSTIGGGLLNTNAGSYATVPGGARNRAAGDYSLAAGRRAKADHDGSFVWADDTDANFSSTTNKQFALRANNGVMVQATNTALDLRGGGTLRVAGAGLGTSTPVFIHRAATNNFSGDITTINHPHCNNDPNAILIVTSNYNPGGVGGVNNPSAIGVVYQAGRWHIFNQNGAVIYTNAAFNVLVFKP